MSPSVRRVILVLVSNQLPEAEHKALAVSADDNRRLLGRNNWKAEASVTESAQTMTLMPTDIAVGVGGHDTNEIGHICSLHPRDCSHTERR